MTTNEYLHNEPIMKRIEFETKEPLSNVVTAYQIYSEFLKYSEITIENKSIAEIFKAVYWYNYGFNHNMYKKNQHQEINLRILEEKENLINETLLGMTNPSQKENIKLLYKYILLQGDILLALALYIMLTDLIYSEDWDIVYLIIKDINTTYEKLYERMAILMLLVKNEELKNKIVQRIKNFANNIKLYPKLNKH